MQELKQVDPRILHRESSAYNQLFDFVEPFKGTKWSTGVLGIRCIDVDTRNRSKAHNVAILAVIPGPRNPAVIAPYMLRTLEAFRGLLDTGMQVRQESKQPIPNPSPGTVTAARQAATQPVDECQRTVVLNTHRPFLLGVLADTPARQKCANHPGVNSYLGACSYCIYQGGYVRNDKNTGGAIRFLGYIQPVPQSLR